MRLFAAQGFAKVTVRDICREARANLAAVNYHFRGKVGLYEEVLRLAIGVMQETTAHIEAAGRGRSAVEQLDASVRILLTRILGTPDPWIHQLMLQELAYPTPALVMIFEQVVVPRTAYLAGVVARMLGCAPDDPRVELCVSSVHAQVMAAVRRDAAGARLLRTGPLEPERIDALATHITRFSIAGIRAIGRT